MLRKLCKVVLFAGLGMATAQSLAQAPSGKQAQVIAARGATTAGEAVTPMGAIWAATAKYVFTSDPDLKPILPKLSLITDAKTVEKFRQELNKAVALEGKKNKDSHVFMFQTKVFNPIYEQKLGDANSLVMAAQEALLKTHPERKNDPEYIAFVNQINGLANTGRAAAKSTAPEGTYAETTANAASLVPAGGPSVPDPAPAEVSAAPESATVAAPLVAVPAVQTGSGAPAWVSWLALILSGLSFAGMMLLFRKQNQPVAAPVPTLPPAQPERATRQSSRKEPNVSWDEMRKYVERQMDERLNPAAPSISSVAPPRVPAPPQLDEVETMLAPLPSPASAPGPRQRTQYANEAPFNNSFPARALSDQPGTYSMFAIVSSEQQPDQGTFAVTGNLASHVRDHRSVLEPVCEYVGGYPLGSESRVITVEPGTVRRRGDDWEVVQRAKVRFE